MSNFVFCCTKLSAETLAVLQQAYGDREIKKLQVYDWHKRFSNGLEGVYDGSRNGHP
jgi:hypothetical protein